MSDERYEPRLVASAEAGQPAKVGRARFPQQRLEGRPWGKPKYTFEQMLESPCKYHSVPGKPATHSTLQCSWTQRLNKGGGLPPPPPPPPPGGSNRDEARKQPAREAGPGDDYPHRDAAYVIYTTERDDKRSLRRRAAEVNATVPPVPQYMHWSEKPITWGREDHPDIMPTPGGYALVLDPTIVSSKFACTFSRVLIDGGSSINILYRDTAVKLGITESHLQPSRTTFHGIVPGQSCNPMGKIRLDVIFGARENFRRESVEFEVVDHSSPYHAILGRPALAKFMAVPHYAYLKLKMPGYSGIITIAGDYKRSMECASASSKLAESLVCAEEMRQFKRNVDL